MMRLPFLVRSFLVLMASLAAAVVACGADSYRVVHSYPHDPQAFTQGLVYVDGRPVKELNELEWVKGDIYANVWHSDRIARIAPATGRVLGWIDLAGLLPENERSNREAVLNGIAYDAAHDRLFVTGKLWPRLFEIEVVAEGRK